MLLFRHHIHINWQIRVALALAAALILSLIGLYVALYQYTTPEKLRAYTQQMSNEKTHISFSPVITRTLFPRPTVILHDVVLENETGRVAQIQEMRLGFAWTNLFGQREIEKLVLNQAQLSLHQQRDGQWDMSEWLNHIQTLPISVNRVYIDNADVSLHLSEQTLQLNHLFWESRRQGSGVFDYHWSLKLNDDSQWWLNSEGRGQWLKTQQGWHSPKAEINFDGELETLPFSGSLNSDLKWEAGRIWAEMMKIKMHSQQEQGHADVQIASISGNGSEWDLKELQAVVNWVDAQQNLRLNGSLSMNAAHWQNKKWNGQQLVFNGNIQHHDGNRTDMTFSSEVQYQDQAWQFSDMKLMTLQNMLTGANRFASEWEGSLYWHSPKQWNFAAQGLFDRQPFNISLGQSEHQTAGSINLSKLDLNAYVNPSEERTQWVQWLQNQLDHRQIELNVRADALILPTLSIHNIDTVIQTDNQHIRAEPFSAHLYDGKVKGMIDVKLGDEWQIQLHQKAEGVQVLPFFQDLFRHGRVEGKGNVEMQWQTKGRHYQEWLENLNGNMVLEVRNGAWLGIDMADILNRIVFSHAIQPNQTVRSATPSTAFEHFKMYSEVQAGVGQYRLSGRLLAPSVDMEGEGETILKDNTMRLDLNLYSNQRKNRLPIRLTGTLDALSASLHYQAITQGIDGTEEKRKALMAMLQQQWNWLKQGGNR